MGGRQSASKYQGAARLRKRRFLRWRSLLLIPGLLVVLLGVSLVGAAVSPGNVSYEAKWADWLRAHHAGLLAQKFEEVYYSAVAPAKGGTPKGLNKIPVTVQVAPSTTDPNRPALRLNPPPLRARLRRGLRLLPRPCLRASHRRSPSPSWSTHRSLEKASGSPPAPSWTACPRCT